MINKSHYRMKRCNSLPLWALSFSLHFLWISCKEYDFELSVLEHDGLKGFKYEMALIADYSESFELDEEYLSFHQFRQVKQLGDHLYYFGFDPRKSDRMEWLNLDTKEKGSIVFEHPSLFHIGPFYVHSFDSIFFTNEVPPRLWIGDSTGRVSEPFQLDDAPVKWDVNEYYFESLTMAHKPYYENGRVFLQLSPLDYWDRDKNKFKFFIWYDLYNQTYGPNYGSPEGAYKSTKIEYPYQYSSAYFLIKGDTTIMSFPLDHNLYVYNHLDGILLGGIEAGSSFLKKLPKPERKNWLGSQEATDFFNSAGFYQELNYHEALKLYSRVVIHEKELLDVEGKITSECIRTYSIQWFDHTLTLIAESEVDNNRIRFLKSSTPTPHGYLAFMPCGQKVSENELWEFVRVSPLKEK